MPPPTPPPMAAAFVEEDGEAEGEAGEVICAAGEGAVVMMEVRRTRLVRPLEEAVEEEVIVVGVDEVVVGD